jgi:hypothetical protein
MRADPLRGQVRAGWALEIETFFGPEMATNEECRDVGGWGGGGGQCGKKNLLPWSCAM